MATPAAAPDSAFRVADDLDPAYLGAFRRGELADRVARARCCLSPCRACPRACGVDRLADRIGACRVGRWPRVASAFPHFGEEDCLRGSRGSGTIFFAGCNLRCVFCQNWELSQRRAGGEVASELLAELMLDLQAQGCHNLNLVTPEHVAPQVIEALALAIPAGLRLPIVYNTSGYDAPEILALLDGLVDVYMPDFKLWRPESARTYCLAADYPERAREAIREMHRQVGPLAFDSQGLARRGVLVRHLVLPGLVDETAAICAWLAREVSPDTYLNVMGQYRPAYRVGTRASDGTPRFAALARPPRGSELAAAFAAAEAAGLRRFDRRWLP